MRATSTFFLLLVRSSNTFFPPVNSLDQMQKPRQNSAVLCKYPTLFQKILKRLLRGVCRIIWKPAADIPEIQSGCLWGPAQRESHQLRAAQMLLKSSTRCGIPGNKLLGPQETRGGGSRSQITSRGLRKVHNGCHNRIKEEKTQKMEGVAGTPLFLSPTQGKEPEVQGISIFFPTLATNSFEPGTLQMKPHMWVLKSWYLAACPTSKECQAKRQVHESKKTGASQLLKKKILRSVVQKQRTLPSLH